MVLLLKRVAPTVAGFAAFAVVNWIFETLEHVHGHAHDIDDRLDELGIGVPDGEDKADG